MIVLWCDHVITTFHLFKSNCRMRIFLIKCEITYVKNLLLFIIAIDEKLMWKGSKNQRVIDVQATLKQGDGAEPVLHCGDYNSN